MLDLSFNALSDPDLDLQALAPLAWLRKLKLNDNPISAFRPRQRQHMRDRGNTAAIAAAFSSAEAYREAVLRAAPSVSELDGDVIDLEARHRTLESSGAHPLAASSQSFLVASAALRALALGSIPHFPSLLQPRGSSAIPRASDGTWVRTRAQVPEGSNPYDYTATAAATAFHDSRGRFLSALAQATFGEDLPAARIPVSMVCSRGGAPAAEGACCGGSDGWLQATDRSFAAMAPLVSAAEQAADISLVASLRHGGAASGGAGNHTMKHVPSCLTEQGRVWLLDSPSLAAGFANGSASLSSGAKSLRSSLRSMTFANPLGGGWTGGQTSGRGELVPEATSPMDMEDAEQLMRQEHVVEVGLGASLSASHHLGALKRPPAEVAGRSRDEDNEPRIHIRPSYYADLIEEVAAAATCIQAVWRSKVARRSAADLRSDHHRRRVVEAAVRIQAAVRGHAVRIGANLASRRAAAAACREAAAAADLRKRTAAATCIQAFARGLGVRRRLKAAVQAARYVDDGIGGNGGGDGDDDEFDFSVGADELMSGLKGVEAFLEAEEPAFMAAAAAALSSAASVQQQRPAVPLGASPLGGGPQPTQADRPSLLTIPPAYTSPPPPPSLPSSAPQTVQAWVEGVVPVSPTSTVASHQFHPSSKQHSGWDGRSHHHHHHVNAASASGLDPSESLTASPSEATEVGGRGEGGLSLALRQQRYREKLEALMAEWGFQDLATAEAYYR